MQTDEKNIFPKYIYSIYEEYSESEGGSEICQFNNACYVYAHDGKFLEYPLQQKGNLIKHGFNVGRAASICC
jgi:hypothetical protein